MPVRVFAVLFAVLATYWFGRSHSYEAFFTTAAFFLTYLGAETYGHFRVHDKLVADRGLFDQFRKELPFEGSITFLRDHDLRVVFERSRLDELHRFTEKWASPDRKFHDSQLQRALQCLKETADGFLGDLAINTWPREMHDLQEIPKEWEREQPQRYEEVSSRLNRRACEIVKKYEGFVQLGRTRLRV